MRSQRYSPLSFLQSGGTPYPKNTDFDLPTKSDPQTEDASTVRIPVR
ncbi:MAG: hypothetical protein LBB61_06670 [Treponema sp.]|nr:hypothetical protein [Treponema sp.]